MTKSNHPLSMLSASEINEAVSILKESKIDHENSSFSYISLEEPDKKALKEKTNLTEGDLIPFPDNTVVVDIDNILLGTITDGDIRRSLLAGLNLEVQVNWLAKLQDLYVLTLEEII